MGYYKSYDRESSIPNVGMSPLGPKRITRSKHDNLIKSKDVHALAMLRGYLQSYAGMSGLIILSAVGALIALMYDSELWVTISLAVFALAAGATIQARRRAKQWLSIVEMRIDQLRAEEAGGSLSNSMRVGGDFAPTGFALSLFGRESRDKDTGPPSRS